MEVQVNVIPGKERVASSRGVKWTDDNYVWSAYRIPYDAGGDPHYTDGPQDYPLDKYAEAIGLTGWNWFARQSHWVGFDFDSIVNHQKGLSLDEIDDLIAKVKSVPWITVRRSKSGKGIHLYVFFENPVKTSNHTEHAALARAVLSNLSSLLGFNFYDKVDGVGGVLWIWHRSADRDSGSFKLIKEGVPLTSIPGNWRDHISQLTIKKRTLPKIIANDEAAFNEIISKTKQINLDEEHRKLLTWFANKPTTWWYDAELSMLVCHTRDLADAHKDLNLRGTFTTLATGKDRPHDQNCFAFPMRNGAWIVRRHGKQTSETEYWIKDTHGWTRCFFNRLPDLATVARINSGVKTGSGSYTFATLENVINAVDALGFVIDRSELKHVMIRKAYIKPGKGEGELIISFDRNETDNIVLADWAEVRGPKYERVVTVATEIVTIEPPDDKIRYTVLNNSGDNWYIKARDTWIATDKSNVKSALTALGYNYNEHDAILGQTIFNNWNVVCKPFEPEYPGNREWNINAPQYCGIPRPGNCDTWLSVIKHIGAGFDEGVKLNQWCAKHDINKGWEYLLLWIVCLLRYPNQPLPYLFLYSREQETGKSTLHEALRFLFKNSVGYARADHALTNPSGFNGELSSAILCVVEEVDLQKNLKAYDRIKDWVTGVTIGIRDMHKTTRTKTNTTHWIQCANDPNFCPILPGDTRISVAEISRPEKPIPKELLMTKLHEESLHFLYHCLNLPIPDTDSRLRIPALSSSLKASIAASNENDVKAFFDTCCQYHEGVATMYSAAYDHFMNTLDMAERSAWTKQKFTKQIPLIYCTGRYGNGGQKYIGNLYIEGIEHVNVGKGKVICTERGTLETINQSSG